jgi:hypothetical protein
MWTDGWLTPSHPHQTHSRYFHEASVKTQLFPKARLKFHMAMNLMGEKTAREYLVWFFLNEETGQIPPGSDPILTQQSLAQLVKNNTVRFFLLGSGGPGGGADGSSTTSWMQQSCKAVPTSEWETSSASSSGGGFGGGNEQLYDCASAR